MASPNPEGIKNVKAPDKPSKISFVPQDSIRSNVNEQTVESSTPTSVATPGSQTTIKIDGANLESPTSSSRSGKSTSSSRSVKLERSVTRSAVEYYPLLSNFDDDNLKKLNLNYSPICGPTDAKEIERHKQIIKSDLEKQKKIKMPPRDDANCRRIFLMRHGERADRMFPGWTNTCFKKHGKYKPTDLNMLGRLPKRANNSHFALDSPLTELGYLSSQMVGRNMRMSHQTVKLIYTSPALNCIQTANGMLKTCRRDFCCKINIEPGLFEYLGWYRKEFPVFLTLDECFKAHIEINRDYKPAVTVQELQQLAPSETVATYYERSSQVIKSILENNDDDCKLLIVTHATSVDACSRTLLGKPTKYPPPEQLESIGIAYPFCSMLTVQENRTTGVWKIADRILAGLTYSGRSNRINDQIVNRR